MPELVEDRCEAKGAKELVLREACFELVDMLLTGRIEVCESVEFLKGSSNVEVLPYAIEKTAALDMIVESFMAE